MAIRPPAVAGSFYPASEAEGREFLEAAFSQAKAKLAKQKIKPAPAHAIVCPHAGWVYSGNCAAMSYTAASNLAPAKTASKRDITVVLAGPNHTGLGVPLSLSQADWQTSLGIVKNDVELGREICVASQKLRFSVRAQFPIQPDEIAHSQEHSLEVQLPFLQFLNPSIRVVPICMGVQDYASSLLVARAVQEAAKKLGGESEGKGTTAAASKGIAGRGAATASREIIFLASSDFTHFENAAVAEKSDRQALAFAEKLDAVKFAELVEANNLSICGHAPIVAALEFGKAMGAKRAKLLEYTNSGAQTNDYDTVVAYASLAVFK